MDCYIVLDVGGTQIKAGIVTPEPALVDDEVFTYPAKSGEDRETILSNLCSIVIELAGSAHDRGFSVNGVGLAFPGLFDYKNGICLIKGIDKYDSIYRVNVKDELYSRINNHSGKKLFAKDYRINFLNDVAAFAVGQSAYGYARNHNRVITLCIGTGAGSAFLSGGKLVETAAVGAPENGYIYNTPFKDSIIDDYISKRGIKNLSLKHLGAALDGKPLSQLAVNGDRKALECFSEFGQNIKQAMVPFIESFRPDCFILGGQIAKSAEYFSAPIKSECEKTGCVFEIETNTSLYAFYGLASSII